VCCKYSEVVRWYLHCKGVGVNFEEGDNYTYCQEETYERFELTEIFVANPLLTLVLTRATSLVAACDEPSTGCSLCPYSRGLKENCKFL
jgi:hypothetical protein